MNRFALVVTCAAALAGPGTVIASDDAPPAVTELGMRQVADRNLDEVYVHPDARLSSYQSIHVELPTVSFRKNWARNQNRDRPGLRIYPEDEQRLREDYAELARKVFSETLESRGYRLSDAPGEGVLVVRPDIVELNIIAPDIQRAARVDQYSESAGEMTLALTLADGASKSPLVRASDHKEDPRWGWMEWRTRPSNYADARRAMRSWANSLGDALAENRWSG